MSRKTTRDKYERFYAAGGWRYDLARERADLQTVIRCAGWKPGETVIEVGAGLCHHAELLRLEGLNVVAVEQSAAAVERAGKAYPDLFAVCADAETWHPQSTLSARTFGTLALGHVFARGMSFWHYELDGVNCQGIDVPAVTERILNYWVAPGCTFVLQIWTDGSGRRSGADGKGVHMNRVEAYEGLFSQFGTIVSLTDWNGRALSKRSSRISRGVIVVVRRARTL